jgi:hypothetical protein
VTPCCHVLEADAVLSNIIPIVLDSGNREDWTADVIRPVR